MKRILVIVAMLTLPLIVMAQNIKKVAILETVDKEGNVPYGVRLQLRSSLTYAISNTSGYEGYDRIDMSSIMGEHNFQRTGMVSDTHCPVAVAPFGKISMPQASTLTTKKSRSLRTAYQPKSSGRSWSLSASGCGQAVDIKSLVSNPYEWLIDYFWLIFLEKNIFLLKTFYYKNL